MYFEPIEIRLKGREIDLKIQFDQKLKKIWSNRERKGAAVLRVSK